MIELLKILKDKQNFKTNPIIKDYNKWALANQYKTFSILQDIENFTEIKFGITGTVLDKPALVKKQIEKNTGKKLPHSITEKGWVYN